MRCSGEEAPPESKESFLQGASSGNDAGVKASCRVMCNNLVYSTSRTAARNPSLKVVPGVLGFTSDPSFRLISRSDAGLVKFIILNVKVRPHVTLHHMPSQIVKQVRVGMHDYLCTVSGAPVLENTSWRQPFRLALSGWNSSAQKGRPQGTSRSFGTAAESHRTSRS